MSGSVNISVSCDFILFHFFCVGRYDGGHTLVHVQLLTEAWLKFLAAKNSPWIQARAAEVVEPGLSSLMCTKQKELWWHFWIAFIYPDHWHVGKDMTEAAVDNEDIAHAGGVLAILVSIITN